MNKRFVRKLYDEKSLVFQKKIPQILLKINKESVCYYLYNLIDKEYLNASFNIVIMIDMIKLCDEDPLLANNIILCKEKSFAIIKRRILTFIKIILYQIGINIDYFTCLAHLIELEFRIINSFPGNISSLKEFYKIFNRSSNQNSKVKDLNYQKKLFLFEAKAEYFKKECLSSSRIYECINSECKKHGYIIEKQIFSVNSPFIGEYHTFDKHFQEKYKVFFNISHQRNKIELYQHGSLELKCENCNLSLKYKNYPINQRFMHIYVLHDDMFSIYGYSDILIENNNSVFICEAFKDYKKFYRINILGSFYKPKPGNLALWKDNNQELKLYNLKKHLGDCFHGLCSDKDLILSIILNFYSTRKCRMIIFTNDLDYVKYYSLNHFEMFSLKVLIKLDLDEDISEDNILYITCQEKRNFQKRILADFVFCINVEDAKVFYKYEKKSKPFIFNNIQKIDMKNFVNLQKSFASLRLFFKEQVNPPKLLDYVSNFFQSLSNLLQREISLEEINFLEENIKSTIFTDYYHKVSKTKSKSFYAKKYFSSRKERSTTANCYKNIC